MMLLQHSKDGLQTKSKFIYTHLGAQTLKSFCLVTLSLATFYRLVYWFTLKIIKLKKKFNTNISLYILSTVL